MSLPPTPPPEPAAPDALPRHHVPRDRLLARLSAPRTRVGVLCAEAGWGKTRLLQELHTGTDRPTVRLDLGPEHRTPGALWAALADAITREPRIPRAELRRLTLPDPPRVESALGGWLAALDELGGPPLLLLDDVHRALSQPVLPELGWLLRHGAGLSIVLTTDTPIVLASGEPLARLADVALESADLAFTPAEARALVGTRVEDAFAAELAESLWRRTGGWPLGLGLLVAAASLQNDPRGWLSVLETGARAAADVIPREIDGGLPSGARDLLLRLGLVPAFDGPTLARMAVPAPDAALLALEAAGIPLARGGDGRWRLHARVAHALAPVLERHPPPAARALRQEVAAACAPTDPTTAIELLWRADATGEAAALIEATAWDRLDAGDADGVARDLDRLDLPPEMLPPALLALSATALSRLRRRPGLEDALAELAQREAAGALPPAALGLWEGLKADRARHGDDHAPALPHLRLAARLLPEGTRARRASALALAEALLAAGQPEAARATAAPLLAEMPPQPADAPARAALCLIRALAEVGDLAEAARIAQDAVQTLEGDGRARPHPRLAEMLVEAGRIAYERGDAASAQALLAEGIARADGEGATDVAHLGLAVWARGLRLADRPAEARGRLATLDDLRHRAAPPVAVELRYVAERIHHSLAAGRLFEAGLLLDAHKDFLLRPPTPLNEEILFAGLAHALRADSSSLPEQVAVLRHAAHASGRTGLAQRAGLYEVASLLRAGDDRAERALAGLLHGVREGGVLIFGELEAVRAQLEILAQADPAAAAVRATLAGARRAPLPVPGARASADERAILRGLAAELADDALARAVGLGLAQVRETTRRLGWRVGARRRADLAAAARTLLAEDRAPGGA